MSNREPLWYCHECHSEMRPLMVPDPHCAECNGDFVEKLENPADDPRDFQEGAPDDDTFPADEFLFSLQNLMQAPGGRTNSPPGGLGGSPRSPGVGGGNFTIHINRSSNNGPRTVISGSPIRGGPGPGPDRTGQIPTLSEYVAQQGRAGGQGPNRGTIDGPLMLQYLLTMLQQGRGRGEPLFDLLGGAPSGAEAGRWGDYVFNQEALDQIITQIMENSQGHPVPASEEILNKLPRDVLEEGSPLLEKDCAICKDQFSLNTEDPDEQVIVTLPCKHPFHEPCIIPWLKSSGTCPVCRYQLVPQPEHHAPGPGTPSGSSGGDNDGQRSPGGGGDHAGGILGGLFHMFGAGPSGPQTNAGPSNNSNNNGNSNSNNASRRNSNPSRRSSGNTNNNRSGTPGSPQPDPQLGPNRRNSRDTRNLPGGWYDVD